MGFGTPIIQALKHITVEPIIFLFFWSIPYLDHGINVLMFERFCHKMYDNVTCLNENIVKNITFTEQNNAVQGEVSRWIMYTKVTMVIPMLYTTIILGAISDRYQRKLPMIIPAVGLALGCIWLLILSLVPQIPVGTVLISSVIFGVTGYFGAALMATSAYLGSMTTSSTRTWRISIYEAVLCSGIVAGASTSGWIIERFTVSAVFGITAGINITSILYTCIRIVELHKVKIERPLWYEACQFGHVKDYVRTLYKHRAQSRRLYIHLIFTAFMIGTCSNQGLYDILVLYLTKTRGFTNGMFSVFTGMQAFLQVVGNIGAMWTLKRFFGLTEPPIIVISLTLQMISFSLISAENISLIWCSLIFVGFNGLTGGAARGFLSKLVPIEEQGQVFAFVAMGQCLTALLASVIFNNFYPFTLKLWVGLTPLIAGLLNIIGIVCAVVVILLRKAKSHTDEILELTSSPLTSTYSSSNSSQSQLADEEKHNVLSEGEDELYTKRQHGDDDSSKQSLSSPEMSSEMYGAVN